MAAWLGRQRKPELLALAGHTTLDELEGLRKEELVSVLDEHLQQNSTRYARNAAFDDYYGKYLPHKRASGAELTSDGELRPKKTRAPKAKKEGANGPAEAGPSSSTPAASRSQQTQQRARATLPTPSAAFRNRVNAFPPSPTGVTNDNEAQAESFSEMLDRTIGPTKFRSIFHEFRDMASSVVAIETFVVLRECYQLHEEVMNCPRLFDIPLPGLSRLGGPAKLEICILNMTIMVTDLYWKLMILWFLTCFFVPLMASWFVNLTFRPVLQRNGQTVRKPRWRFDPLVFNTARMLMGWIVYHRGFRFWGLFPYTTPGSLEYGIPFSNLIISSAIGALASFYDATQRR